MGIVRTKKFEKKRTKTKIRRRLRMLLTRDTDTSKHVALWVTRSRLEMDKSGFWHVPVGELHAEHIELTERECWTLFGRVPRTGQKIGVKLVKHRWHS